MALKYLSCLLTVAWIATGHVIPDTGGRPAHMLTKRAAVLYRQGAYTLAFANHDIVKSTLLRSLLDNLYSNIQPVIQDLKAPGTSKAYDTFFKDAANKDFVTTLFENVAAGAPVYPPTDPPQPWQPYSPKGSPVILVISQLGQWAGEVAGVGYRDGFTWCQENKFLTAFVAFNKNKVPFIQLCPFFFDAKPPDIYGDTPPASVNKQPASNCLQVNAITNNFRKASPRSVRQPAGFTLTQYRSWILLEELAHLYYQAATRKKGLDIYNVNRARKLSAQKALGNGPTYSYYAAAVAGNCVDFPTKVKGQELLEVDTADPEEVAEYGAGDPMHEYAVTIAVTDIQLDPSTPVTESVSKDSHCDPGTCFVWCICA